MSQPESPHESVAGTASRDATGEHAKQAELRGIIAEKEAALSGETPQTPWAQAVIAASALIGIVLPLSKQFGWPVYTAWGVFVVAVLWLIGHIEGIAKLKGEIENARAQLTILAGLPLSSESGSESYFQNLVTINVTNLREYYFLVKEHTNSSFRTALVCGVLGFGLVCASLVANALQLAPASFSYVSAGAGVITEFIAAVFFYLYNRTVRQLKDYHDSLLDVQNVLLSLRLLESVDNAERKAPMIMRMLDYLLRGRSNLLAQPEVTGPGALGAVQPPHRGNE